MMPVEDGPWEHVEWLAPKGALAFEELTACGIVSMRRLAVKRTLTVQRHSFPDDGQLGWRFRGFDLRRRNEAGEIIRNEIERFLSPIGPAPFLSSLD